MKNVKKFIYNELTKLGYKVYDSRPPANVPYPFIEYSADIPFRNINPLLYVLTINIWDRAETSVTVETVADDIDNLIENLSYIDEHIQVKVKSQARQQIDDPDIEIKRRLLTYQLRVFKKEI